MRPVLFAVLLTVSGNALSQANLPICPETGVKHNCFGTSTSSSGHKYVGEWRDGKRHGVGVYTWPDGRKHVGEWRDGQRSGHGITTDANGVKFVGEWRESRANGQGTIYAADGTVLQSGQWVDGKLQKPEKVDQGNSASGRSKPPATRRAAQPASCEDGHWIISVSSDGKFVKLEDGSIWEVDDVDTIDSALWLPATAVIVCNDKLINTDDKEMVSARRLR